MNIRPMELRDRDRVLDIVTATGSFTPVEIATALEVVDAQTTAIQARNAQEDGLIRYRVALANLQTLTGN